MSSENVELVRRLQPSRRDLVGAFSSEAPAIVGEDGAELFAPDFEVRFISGTPGVGQLEGRGPKGLAEMWRDWLTPYHSYEVEVEGFLDAGDAVVVLTRVLARTERDGVLVEHSPAAVWRIRDGKITALHFYLDRTAAFEAAGVTEEIAQRTK